MFRRRRSRARRAKSWQNRVRRQRRLTLEPLEERRLLAIMTVTNLNDDTLANLAGDGQLSLREAIQAINIGAAVDGIDPTSGVFGTDDEVRFDPALFAAGMGMINLADAAGELDLLREMTITGPGSALLTIDAGDGADNAFNTGDGFRIFNIDDATVADQPAIITGLTLTGGDVTNVGGAIRAVESLTLRDSVVTGNATVGANMHGGGIYAAVGAGSIEITNTTISRNQAGHYGGGLYLSVTSGDAAVRDSLIYYNRTGAEGAGIRAVTTSGDVTITNSTISMNFADHSGGGISVSTGAGGVTTIAHSTVVLNISDFDTTNAGTGGGIFGTGAGTLIVDHSIVARNLDPSLSGFNDLDVVTTPPGVFDVNFSLIGDNTGTNLTEAQVPDADGNLIGDPGGAGNIDPQIGPLAGNGGPTATHALLAASLAINAGDVAIVMPPTNDQRGAPFVRIAGPGIDMGAYERQTVAGLSLVVDTLLDENDGDYSPGDLSLREAVGLANGSIGLDEVTFAAALNAGTILLKLGEIRITDDVEIDAANLTTPLIVDASGSDDDTATDDGGGSRIFNIDDGDDAADAATTIVALVLTGGDADGDGGAILSSENLTLSEVVVDGNHTEVDGGGIAVTGGLATFQMTRSTVSGNSADGGGGLYLEGVQSFIIDSTVSGNSAVDGGGIHSNTEFDGTPSTSIVNSTISGNTVAGRGGGIFNVDGLTDIRYSTITNNTAPNDSGSGVASYGDNATITRVRQSIIAGNASNSDINFVDGAINSFQSLGFNLIGMGTGLGEFVEPGDQANEDNPGLAPLALNGGPTRTHRVLATSPALDAGDQALSAGVGGVPEFDQRGAPLTRIFDGNNNGNATIDIGAFELNEVLIAPDQFEPNDTQATATVLGSPPFLTVPDLTIHDVNIEDPPDEDFFKIVAHDTGKLSVRIYFTHALGDLDMEILDMNGNSIASSLSFDDDELVIIPVVSQQMYFVHVFGANLGGVIDTNEYTLEIENFPTPVPTGVELDPASDTGMMDNDNVTGDSTPTLLIQTDVLNFADTNGNGTYEDPDLFPIDDEDKINVLTAAEAAAGNVSGIAVQVTLVNTTTGDVITGFAEPIVATIPDVYRFTVPDGTPLTDGVYIISARTVIFDGLQNLVPVPTPAIGRSSASPPLRLTIDTAAAPADSVSVDLLDASDTGIFDNDNVTNKMQPAFQGIAPAGAKIRFFVNGELVGQTVAGSDASDVGHAVGGIGGLNNDGLGLWEITAEPLDDGAYDITLDIEDNAGNVTTFDPRFHGPLQPVDFIIDTQGPNTPFLDLITPHDTGRHDHDNITNINTPQVSMTTTDPNVEFSQLLFTDNFKFRIYDRFENSQEVLIYDSATVALVDAELTPNDMFTALTQLNAQLPFLTPASPGIIGNLFADGVHNLKLEVEDRAGNISHDFLLEITIDTVAPPISFGVPDGTNNTDGLTAASDSGVTTEPATFADRVTSDTTPTFWGRAEADSIVRLYLDLNNNGVIDLASDTFLGQTVAVPLDGNDAFPDGYWEITSALDLNQLVGLPKDGVRRLLATAQDVAGNPMPVLVDNLPVINQGVAALQIFIDTQGPQITGINLGPDIDFDFFDPKGSAGSPTPLVHSLFIDVQDLPFRLDQAGTINDFLYPALVEGIAETVGNYDLVGDHVGHVVIQEVIVHFVEPVVSGQPAFASIELVFAEPLPDDRYTLTVRDNLVDPAGNRLDGESGAGDPSEDPIFPTGDGVPGGSFEFFGRFTVDSHPEIGVWAAGTVLIDTNGNFLFDPEGIDFTNRDLAYTLGFASDYVFAGNFGSFDLDGDGDVDADGFDKLAAYGRVGNEWRFLIDVTNDGVPDLQVFGPAINGIPVAGNFDGNDANGDEVGIFTGSSWFFDTNHDFIVDIGIASAYTGFPVVGDFDADGDDDVGTYIASQPGGNFFVIDINTAAAGAAIDINGNANHQFRVGVPGLGTFGFPGVRERPVAADMNADGADDLGLWVPDGTAIVPGDQGEWFFLLSDFDRGEGGEVLVTDTVIDRIIGGGTVDFIPFSTTPFGNDLYARFGNSFSLPIVGNFDPPLAGGAAPAASPPVVQAPVTALTTPPAAAQTTPAPIVAAVTVAPPAPARGTIAPAEPPAIRLPVPTVASAVVATKSVASPTKTAKPPKTVKLPVPAIEPAGPKTVVSTAKVPKSTKNSTKNAVTVAVPSVKPTTKTTKAKAVAITPAKPVTSTVVNVPQTAAIQKSVVTGTSEKKTVTTTIVEPAAASTVAAPAPKIARTTKNSAIAPSRPKVSEIPQPKPLKVAATAAAPTQPVAAKADKTVTKTQPAAQPDAARRTSTFAPAKAAKSAASSSISPLAGLFDTGATNTLDRFNSDRSVLARPEIADAAIADLLLTLADIATDAVAADAESGLAPPDADDWQTGNHNADELAFELAWESVAFAVR